MLLLIDLRHERMKRWWKIVIILKFSVIVLIVVIELVGDLLGSEVLVDGKYFLIGPVLS